MYSSNLFTSNLNTGSQVTCELSTNKRVTSNPVTCNPVTCNPATPPAYAPISAQPELLSTLKKSKQLDTLFHQKKAAQGGEGGEGNDADDRADGTPLGIKTKTDATPAALRLKRYALQNQAAKLLPKERVKKCLRHRIALSTTVDVMYNPARQKANYSNLQRCGSVWMCPVCAAQISEVRKVEVKTAIDGYRESGGFVSLLTLTVPHYSSSHLKTLLDQLRIATRRFFNGTRRSKEFWALSSKEHHIKALEVTHGYNGWHPHFHVLLFSRTQLTDADQAQMLELWQDACRIARLPRPNHHGVDLRNGEYADQYVSKWGLEHEVTKSHLKQGSTSYTPWDLLKYSMINFDGDPPLNFGALFQQFAISFKGSRQLTWSRGLKALFGIDNKTDEEAAEETESTAVMAMSIAHDLWPLVVKYDRRTQMLELVEADQNNNTCTAFELLGSLAEMEYLSLLKAGT